MNNQTPGLGQHSIMGDFNFDMHADADSSTYFRDPLEIHGLQQHLTKINPCARSYIGPVITHIDAEIISDGARQAKNYFLEAEHGLPYR